MSRKYSQRGYQDDGAREERGNKTVPSRPEGPKGRGLGAPTESSIKCARCGTKIAGAIEVDSTCSNCRSDLHSCTNCTHFDSSVRFECREPIAERIGAKAKRNTCESFAPKVVQGFGSDSKSASDDPKAAFDALFDF